MRHANAHPVFRPILETIALEHFAGALDKVLRLDREHRRHCTDCGTALAPGSSDRVCNDCAMDRELRAECAWDARDDADDDDFDAEVLA